MKRPIVITIMSVLQFIAGAFLILAGFGIATNGYKLLDKTKLAMTEQQEKLGLDIYGGLMIAVGVICVVLAAALWRQKPWAWWLAFLLLIGKLGFTLYGGYQHGFDQNVIIQSVVYGLFALYFLAVKKHFK